MPIPSSINDLSTTAASNSPSGSEDLGTADDYLRVYASYIAALRDVVLSGTANLSTANLTYTGTLTGSTGVLNIGSGQIYKDASGNVGVGTSVPGAKLESSATSNGATLEMLRLSNNGTGANTKVQINFRAASTSYAQITGGYGASAPNLDFAIASGGDHTFTNNGTVVVKFDASGNQINTPSTTPPTLTVNGQMNITPTSNTNVCISYRGSDGTTRTANITLA